LGFRNDREDFDGFVGDIIEDPNFAHTKTKLWLAHTPEPLDPALAHLSGFVAKMRFDRVSDLGAPSCGQSPQCADGARGQNDLEPHFGQNLARNPQLNNALELTGLCRMEAW